ncbi:hypothetical protein A3849_02105 [Paenibacillus sp. P46E]|nr:hypothetical protein A3849_02105 [Paenibacillus sp. P46E]
MGFLFIKNIAKVMLRLDYLKLSKEVSYALRHAPWEYELELDNEDWVDIEREDKGIIWSLRTSKNTEDSWNSPLQAQQGAVSLPAINRYTQRLSNGEIPPPIKVDNNIIVDGNHRYRQSIWS